MFFKRILFFILLSVCLFCTQTVVNAHQFNGVYIENATNGSYSGLMIQDSVFIVTDRSLNSPKCTYQVEHIKDVLKIIGGTKGIFSVFRVLKHVPSSPTAQNKNFRYILIQKGKDMIYVYYMFDTKDADIVLDQSVAELFPKGLILYAERAPYRGPISQ